MCMGYLGPMGEGFTPNGISVPSAVENCSREAPHPFGWVAQTRVTSPCAWLRTGERQLTALPK